MAKRIFAFFEKFRHLASEDRGAELVELAISIPLLLLLFLSTAEFGRLYFKETTLAKGTRLAARYLTNVPLNSSDARTYHYAKARNLVVYGKLEPPVNSTPIVPGLTTANVLVTQTGGIVNTVPERVTVQITGVNFQPSVNLGGLINRTGFSINVPMSPSTTMRYVVTNPMN